MWTIHKSADYTGGVVKGNGDVDFNTEKIVGKKPPSVSTYIRFRFCITFKANDMRVLQHVRKSVT